MAQTNPGPIQAKPTTDPATQINNAMQSASTPINTQGAVQGQARGKYDQPLQAPAQQINNAMQTASAQPTQSPAQQVQSGWQNAATQTKAQPSVQAQANAQTTQEAMGGVYRVGDNGQAPKGLKVGDQVVTGGGTYTIKSVNADGTYQSQLTNPNQTTGTYTGQYANAPVAPTNVYRVGADGKAPTGLKVGDQVVTGGGTYQITGVNADGSYQSQLVNRDQTTGNYTGAYTNGQGTPAAQTQPQAQTQPSVYKVGADGKAPSGLKVGDQVVTAGGTYTIVGVNPDGTYQSRLTDPNQTTGTYTGQYVNGQNGDTSVQPTGNIYKVGADGKAPTGLKVGDQVVTAGGTYIITGVNPDGTYQSQLINRDQNTGNYTGQYTNSQPEIPGFAQPYQSGIDYSIEIQKALARGDLVAAAYFEQQRNAKIDAEGLGDKYAKTYQYAQYLDQLTPERQAMLMNGYVRESLAPQNPGDQINDLLTEWRAAAEAQAQGQIDYATQQGINELTRAMEDAQPQFQQQLDQLDIDTARAMSNSAMYAEARGDRGGIGQSQYNEVQAAALKNKQAIDTARTKLATDTARQIADLRAQGEFQKADQLLTLSQQYLAKAMELAQWNANWALSQEEMARELEQWEANHAIQVANITGIYNGQPTRAAQDDERDRVASVGEALLKVGVMPSDEQLAAIGMTKDQAQAYIWALTMGFSTGGSSSGGGSYSGSGGSSSYSGSGSGTPYTPPSNPTTTQAVNAALTYHQPKDAAPTPWQKPIASGTQ